MTPSPISSTPPPAGLPAGLPEEIASVVIGDLAQRLEIERERVAIVSAERLAMPPGLLGCGGETAQADAFIIGIEIVAQAGSESYVYRTDARRLIPCSANFPGKIAPIYLSSPPATPHARPQDLAVADLAERLSIPAAEIRIVSVEAVEWRDASLGCPKPGMAYAQVITPGYRVILEAAGRTHRYHGADGRMFLCTP